MEDLAHLQELIPNYAVRLGAAILCGLLLGAEREHKDKPAGLRTILLITLGSALYMLVSELIPQVTRGPETVTRADPTRVASQVVTGIGFLGAGTIIRARGSIHGLTTAAAIWVAAAIGLACGLGFPLLGVILTLVVILSLALLQPVRAWLSSRGEQGEVEIWLPNDALVVELIRQLLKEHEVPPENLILQEREGERLRAKVRYQLSGSTPARLLDNLHGIEGVEGVPAVPAGS